ncbi:MAG: ABC transporter ATP-binding protein [Alphaproteobacteria bacterium]|nr:ABC transporter ATP-binding protein [Alphaproteobacteria bacterium]
MDKYPAKAFSYFLKELKGYRRIYLLLLISIAIALFFDKLAPYYFSKIIDVFSGNIGDKKDSLELIFKYFGLFILSIFLFNILRRFGMFLCQKIETGLRIKTKRNAMIYMAGHSERFFNEQHSASLGAKVGQLSDQMSDMFMLSLWEFYTAAVVMLITIGMLFWVNYFFALVFLFWLIVLAFLLGKSSKKLKECFEYRAERRSVTTSRIVDILSNHTLLKSFASLNYECEKLAPFLDEERKALSESFNKMENARFIQFIAVALFQISMVLLAIYLWYCGLITTGNVVFMLLLVSSEISTFQFFVFSLLHWNRSTGEAENTLKLLSQPHEITDKQNAKKLKVKRGVIEFKNVFFKYSTRKQVMENFNLKIKSHEKIGLVGISGSGKSTLVNLLQRFYEVHEGAILIDGQNISDVTLDSLHNAIAVIPQDTALFYRSIFENIAYGRSDVTKKAVFDAAKKAYADEFITEMPNGYDSMVGERGVKVSGGQRQRIAVARAILKNAPILILDEATSALDSVSEEYIQKSMKSLMRGKTVIAIAHRLSTLQKMDRIIVMSKGKIIEQGTPEELLKKRGTYAKLWKIQTGIGKK